MRRERDGQTSGCYQLHPGFEFRTVPNPSAGESDFLGVIPDRDDAVQIIDPTTLLALRESLDPVSRDELIERVAERIQSRRSTVAETVDWLISTSILIPAESDRSEMLQGWVENGWLHALHYHLRTRTDDDGDDVAATELRERGRRGRPDHSDVLGLPDPDPLPDLPLQTVMLERETCRNFDGEHLSAQTVANVLGNGSVTVPETGTVVKASAPETHCFDVYAVAIRTTEIDRGVYRYDSQTHCFELIEPLTEPPEALDRRIEGLLISQPYARGAAFLLIVTANYGAIRSRFDGPRDVRSAYAALSMRAHRFLLAATAFDVATFQTGAFHESEVKEFLSFADFDAHPEYALAFGGTEG